MLTQRTLNKIALVAICGVLGGCAHAEITKRIYQPRAGGVVKYSEGWGMTEKSRALAMQKMAELCMQRGYTINSESIGNELGPVTSSTNANGQVSVSQSNDRFVYIDFTCK